MQRPAELHPHRHSGGSRHCRPALSEPVSYKQHRQDCAPCPAPQLNDHCSFRAFYPTKPRFCLLSRPLGGGCEGLATSLSSCVQKKPDSVP